MNNYKHYNITNLKIMKHKQRSGKSQECNRKDKELPLIGNLGVESTITKIRNLMKKPKDSAEGLREESGNWQEEQ